MLSNKDVSTWRLCQFLKWHKMLSQDTQIDYNTSVDKEAFQLDPAMIEINETNYCDQKPITIEFSFEEHEFLIQVLNHAFSAYDFIPTHEIYDLPADSEIKKNYDMLMSIKQKSDFLWFHRFGHPPYNNN